MSTPEEIAQLQKRRVGWWLPDPRCYRDEDSDRYRFFAGWALRFGVLLSAAFGLLMFTETGLTTWGAVACSLMFLLGTEAVIGIVIAVVWSDL